MRVRNLLLGALLSLGLAGEALAGSGALTVLDSTGATKTFTVVTNGSGDFVSRIVLCDATAAANCAAVTAGGAVTVDGSAVVQPVALTGGSLIVGKVGIDQTTPGTTNGVALTQVGSTTVAAGNGVAGAGVQRVAIASDNSAIPVTTTLTGGSNIIGKVGIDQTTPGTTNGTATTQIGSATVLAGNGVTGTGSQRVTVASDNTPFTVNSAQSGTWTVIDSSASLAITQGLTTANLLGTLPNQAAVLTTAPTYVTAQTSPLTMTTRGEVRSNISNGGTSAAVGAPGDAASQQTSLFVNNQASIFNGATWDRWRSMASITSASTTGIAANGLAASATGGCIPYHLASGTGASTNSTNIKNSAGTLCGIQAVNTTATIYYLRMYDASSAPTCSSATGAVHSYPVPANTSGAGFAIPIGPFGELYANGIGFCVTGGGSDTDNTSAAAGVFINGSYK